MRFERPQQRRLTAAGGASCGDLILLDIQIDIVQSVKIARGRIHIVNFDHFPSFILHLLPVSFFAARAEKRIHQSAPAAEQHATALLSFMCSACETLYMWMASVRPGLEQT